MNKNIAKIFSSVKYFLLIGLAGSVWPENFSATTTPSAQNTASARIKTIASFKSPIAKFTAEGVRQKKFSEINAPFLCALKSSVANKYLGDGNTGNKSVGLTVTAKQLTMEIVGISEVGGNISDFCNNMRFSFEESTGATAGATTAKKKYLSIESIGDAKNLVFADQKGTVTWIAFKITDASFMLISKDSAAGGILSGFVIVADSAGNLSIKHHTTAIAENEKVAFQIINQTATTATEEVRAEVASAMGVTDDSEEGKKAVDAAVVKKVKDDNRKTFLSTIKGAIGRINFQDAENSSAFFETDVARILVIAAGVGVFPQTYDGLVPAEDANYKYDEILQKAPNLRAKNESNTLLPYLLPFGFETSFEDSLDLATQLYNACKKPSVDQELLRRPGLAQLIGATITKIYEDIQSTLNANGELESNPKYKKADEDVANPTSLTGIKSALFEKFRFRSTSTGTNFEAYLAAVNSIDNEPDDQKFNIERASDKSAFNISKIEAQIILLAACVKVGITADTLDPAASELILDPDQPDPTTTTTETNTPKPIKVISATRTNDALLVVLRGTSFVKKSPDATTVSVQRIPSALLTMDTKLKVIQKLASILDIEKNPEIVNAINVGRPGIGSTIRVVVSKLYADDNLRRYKDASGKFPVIELKKFVDDNFQTKIIANFYEELKEIDQQFIRARSSEDAKKWIANLGRVFTKRLESLAKDFSASNANSPVTDETFGQNDISKYIQDFSNQSQVAPLVFLRYNTSNIKEIAAWKVFDSTKMPDNSKAIDKAHALAYDLMKDLTVKEALNYVSQMFQNSGSLSEVQATIFKNVLQILCAKWDNYPASSTASTGGTTTTGGTASTGGSTPPTGGSSSTTSGTASSAPTSVIYAAPDKIEGRLGLRIADIGNMKKLIRQYEELTNVGKPISDSDLFGKCVKAIKLTKTKVFESEFVPLAFRIIHKCCLKTGDSVVWDRELSGELSMAIKKPSLHQLNPYCSYTLSDFWEDFCENGYQEWEKAKLINWEKPEQSEPVSAILNFVLDSIDALSPTEKEAVSSIAQKAATELTRVKGTRNVVQADVANEVANMTVTQKLQKLQVITNKVLVTNKDINDFLAITLIISVPDTFKDLDTNQKALYGKCLRRAINSQVFKASLANKIGGDAEGWTAVETVLATRLGGAKVALIWTDPSDATKKYTLKLFTPTSGDPFVRMVNDDYLATECHFEFVTVEQTAMGEIVNIKFVDRYLLVPTGADDTIALAATPTPADAAAPTPAEKATLDNFRERAKFLKVKVNDTIRAFQNRFTGGFLTVRKEVEGTKTIISLTTRISGTPAGQRNADGTISPKETSSFGFVPITKLHQDLLKLKNSYTKIEGLDDKIEDETVTTDSGSTVITGKNTKFLTIVAEFVQLLTDLQSTSQTSPDNLILVTSIFKSFIDLCARKTTAQWKWFISSKDTDGQTFVQLATKIHDVIKTLSAGDSTVQAALGGLNKSLTDPVTQSERETALLPENNAIINISIGKDANLRYLKTYQDRSADGTVVVFVKADCEDPMDPDAQFKFVITDGKCLFYKNGTNLVITSSPTTINPQWNNTTRTQQERLKLLPLNTDAKAAAQQFFAIEPSDSSVNAKFDEINFFITNLSEAGGTWQKNTDGYICSMTYDVLAAVMKPITKIPSLADQKFKYQVTSKLVSQLDTKDPLAAVNSLSTMVQDLAGVDNKAVVLGTILKTIDKFVKKLQTDSVAWATAIGNNQLQAAFESLFTSVAKTIKDLSTPPTSTTIPAQSITDLKTQFKDTINQYLGINDLPANKTFGTCTISWIDPSGQKSYLKAVGNTLTFSPTADSSDTTAQFEITVTQNGYPSDLTDPADLTKNTPSELNVTIKNGDQFVGVSGADGAEKVLALLPASATFTTSGPLLNMIAKNVTGSTTKKEWYFEVDPQTAMIYVNDAVNKFTPIPLARASHLRIDKLSDVKVKLLKARVTEKTVVRAADETDDAFKNRKAAFEKTIKDCLTVLSKMFTKTAPTLEELESTYYEFDRLLNLFLKGTGKATAKEDEDAFNAFKDNNSDAVNYLFQSFDRVYKAYRATDADLYTKKLEALGKLKAKWDFGFRIEEPGVLKTGDKILLKSVANNKFVVAQDATIEKVPVFFVDANVEDAISAVIFEIVELNGRYALKYTKDAKSYVLSTKLSALLETNPNAIEAYKKQLSRAILVPQLSGWALETNSSLLEQFAITQGSDKKISIRAVYKQTKTGIVENGTDKGFLTTTSEEEDQGYLRANDWSNGLPKSTAATGDNSQKFEMIVLTAQTAEVFTQLGLAAQKSDAAEKLAIYKALVPLATTSEAVLLVVQEIKKFIKENLKIDEPTWTGFVQAFSDQIQKIAQELDQRLPDKQILSSINLLLQQQYQDDNNGNFAIKVIFDDGKERFLKYAIETDKDENDQVVFKASSVVASGTDKIDPLGSFITKIEGAVEAGQKISIQVKNGISTVLEKKLTAAAASKTRADSAFLSVNADSNDLAVSPALESSLLPAQKLSFVPMSGRKFMLKSGTLDLVVGENDSLSFSKDQPTRRIVNLEFVPLTATQVEFARIEGLPIETAISEFGRRVRVLTPKSKDADKQLVLERVAKFIQLLTSNSDLCNCASLDEKKAIVKTRENDIISLITKLGEVLGDKYKEQVAKLTQAWNTQTDGPKNGDVVLIKSALEGKYIQLWQDPQTKALYLKAETTDPVVATRFTVGRNMSTVWFSIKDAAGKELFMQTNTPDIKDVSILSVKKARTRLGFGYDQALVKFKLASQLTGDKTQYSLKGLATKDAMGNLSPLGEDVGYLKTDGTNDGGYLRLFTETPSPCPMDANTTTVTSTTDNGTTTKVVKTINPTQLFDFTIVYGSTAQIFDQIAQLQKKPEFIDQLAGLSDLVDVVTIKEDGKVIADEVAAIIKKANTTSEDVWKRFQEYCRDSVLAIADKYDAKFGAPATLATASATGSSAAPQSSTAPIGSMATGSSTITDDASKTRRVAWTELLSANAIIAHSTDLADGAEVVILSVTNNKLLRAKKESVIKNDYLFVCADADDMTQATIFKTVLFSIKNSDGKTYTDYYGFVSQDDLASGQFITNVVIDKATDLATAKKAFTRLNFVPNTKDNFLKADSTSKYQQFAIEKIIDPDSLLAGTYKITSVNAAYDKMTKKTFISKDCIVTVGDGSDTDEGCLRVYKVSQNQSTKLFDINPVGAASDKKTQAFKIFSVDKNSSDFLKGLRALSKESVIEKRIKAYIDYIQSANTVILANLLRKHLIGFINENKKDAITWTAFVTQGAPLIQQFVDAFTKTFGTTTGLDSISDVTSLMSAPFTQSLSSRKYAIRAIINNQPSDKWLELTQESAENLGDFGLDGKGYTKFFVPTLTAKEKLLPQAMFDVKVIAENMSISIYSHYEKGSVVKDPNQKSADDAAASSLTPRPAAITFDTMVLAGTDKSVVAKGAVSKDIPDSKSSSLIYIYPIDGLKFKLQRGDRHDQEKTPDKQDGFYFVGQSLDEPSLINRIQSKFPDGSSDYTQEQGTIFEFVELSEAEVATIMVRAKSLAQRVREYTDSISKIDSKASKEAREQAVSEIENMIAQIGSDDALKKEAVNVYGQIENLITMACDAKRVSTYKAIADRTALLKDALQKAVSGGLAPDTKVFLICGDDPILPVEQAFGAGVKQTVLKAVANGDIFNDAFLMTTLSNGPLTTFILGDKTLAANVLDPKAFAKFTPAKKELFTALYFVSSAETPPNTLTTFKIIDLADGLKGFSESTTLSFVTLCLKKDVLGKKEAWDKLLRIYNPNSASPKPYAQTETSLTNTDETMNKFMLIVCDEFYNNAKALATPITSTGAARLADVNKKLQGFNDLFLQTTTDNKGHARVFYAAFKKAFTGVSGFALQTALGADEKTVGGLIKKVSETWALTAEKSSIIKDMKALSTASAPYFESYANDLIAMIDAGPASGTSPDAWFTKFKEQLNKYKERLTAPCEPAAGRTAQMSISDARVLTFMNSKVAAGGRKLQTSDLGNAAIKRQVKMARYEFQSQLVQNLIKALQKLLPKGTTKAKVVLSATNISTIQDPKTGLIKQLMTANQAILKSRVAAGK